MYNNCKSIIIYDWDDTLFPTSWVTQHNINLNDPLTQKKYMKFFSILDATISKLLIKSIQLGNVIIITNALPIWIKISSGVLPKTRKLFKYIKIISARKEYQEKSNNMTDWKMMAFKNEFNQQIKLSKYNNYNIISIGDADHEYKALVDLQNHTMNNKILKTIKLIKNPSIDQIYDELKVLNNTIGYAIKYSNHIDWNFQQN